MKNTLIIAIGILMPLYMFADRPDWEVEPDSFRYVMTFEQILPYRECSHANFDTNTIAAFINDELVGVSKLNPGSAIHSIDVYSNSLNDSIRFQFYFVEDDFVFDAAQKFQFISSAVETEIVRLTTIPYLPDLFLSQNTINENVPIGTTIGQFSLLDTTLNSKLKFSSYYESSFDHLFEIDDLQLKTKRINSDPDSYNLDFAASHPNYCARRFAYEVIVQDVFELPEVTTRNPRINENETRVTGLDILIVDEDRENIIFSNKTEQQFIINCNRGQFCFIYARAGKNFETDIPDTIEYIFIDSLGNETNFKYPVSIVNINEPHSAVIKFEQNLQPTEDDVVIGRLIIDDEDGDAFGPKLISSFNSDVIVDDSLNIIKTGGLFLEGDFLPIGFAIQDEMFDSEESNRIVVDGGISYDRDITVTQAPVLVSKSSVVSPNNDGINDVFEIEVMHIETIQLKLLDTQGRLIFQSDDYQNQFNGRNTNGEPMPNGEYYYSIQLGSYQEHRGSFLIIQ